MSTGEDRSPATVDDYLEAIKGVYERSRRLIDFIHSLCEGVLRAIVYDVILMIPFLILLLLVYLNVFKGYLLRLSVLTFSSMLVGVLGLLLYFYLSVANIFREVLFLKLAIGLPDLKVEDLEMIGESLRGHHVKVHGRAKDVVSFKPIASEEDVYGEDLFVSSRFDLSVLRGTNYLLQRSVNFPIFLSLEDENGETLHVVMPPNCDEYKDLKVTFKPLRNFMGKEVSLSLVLRPMIELITDRKARKIFSQGDIRRFISDDYFPSEPLGEVFLFKEILKVRDYLGQDQERLRALIEGEDVASFELRQEYIAPKTDVLVLGVLRKLKELPISDSLKEQVRRQLRISDDDYVITAEKGKPFLISEGDLDDFVRKYTVKKGFSREYVVFVGSAIVIFIALLGWLVTVFTIDPSGSLWLSVPITSLALIPYAVSLGEKAQRIRDELMLDKLLERQITKVLD